MNLAHRLTLALLALALAACGTESDDPAPEQQARPVKLLTVGEADGGGLRRFPATVEAAESSTLAFQVSGSILEIPVKEAQEVEQGAVLARLDARDLQSNLDAARAQFDNAESEYQRALRLIEGDAIARGAVEQRKAARDTAKAQLDAAEKALRDTVLTAPFDGVVATVHASKLQNVAPQAEIVTLIGSDEREVTVDIPASIVARTREGDPVDTHVVLDVAPGVRIPATFDEATLEADPATQTYEVTFRFQPPTDLNVLPGMNATLIAEANGTRRGEAADGVGVSVPLAAVQSEAERNYVWVIDRGSMTASKRFVAIQPGIGETVVVTEGLDAGETIAGAGAAYLAEGMAVREWTE
ncbi:MAG: efflux RND transporter periplasmic adaptor subunit [Holophagales bacterium]|nr:efflux RND transporter periplasmic adaptor subunit [Holophagales bacterium]